MKVNVREIVRDKNVALYKKIPNFLFSLLERIVCQKEVNDLLEANGHCKNVPFISSSLDYLNVTRIVDGKENIKNGKKYVFASNHPLGGVDAFVLAEAMDSQLGSAKIVVNDILMKLEPLAGICVPVNKHGKQTPENIAALNKVFMSSTPILYFPAGLCSRKIKGKIVDTKWKNSFVKKAIETERDIIPVWIDSVNSSFFYNFAAWRKRLGIKANLEMLLLPSELFKKRGKSIRIVFGEPIPYTKLAETKNIAKSVTEIKEKCYNLK